MFHVNLLMNGLTKTNPEWDFNTTSRDGKPYRVSINLFTSFSYWCSSVSTSYSSLLNSKGYCLRFWDQAKHFKTVIILRISNLCCSIDMASFWGPFYGICMGHQLLGQALAGKTFKMKFGHHGGTHPVRNNRTGQVEISA